MSKSLLKSTTTVSSMTLISRVLGFVRDMVFAYIFGAVGGFDAFVVAYKIPNFMRRLFAEGAFSQAFVPVLSEYRQQKSPEEAQQLINRTAGSLASVLFGVTILTEIFAPIIIMVFAPGFLSEPDRFDLAVNLLRITLPYIMLISLTAFGSAILNTYGVFGPPAFTPVLMNLALISAGFSAGYLFGVPIKALAWGVVVGAFVSNNVTGEVFDITMPMTPVSLGKPEFSDNGFGLAWQVMFGGAIILNNHTELSLVFKFFQARPGKFSNRKYLTDCAIMMPVPIEIEFTPTYTAQSLVLEWRISP